MNIIQYLRNIVWMVSFMIIPYGIYATDAPVTTAAIVTACPGNTVTVPVTVVNFTNIMEFTLSIEFDTTVMSFNAGLSSVNPVLAGSPQIGTFLVGGSIHKIVATWFNTNPQSLASGGTVVTHGFNYIGGTTTLHFNDIDPPGCEYADATLTTLNDVPTSAFYHDGQVSTGALAGSVTGGSTIYFNNPTGNLTLSGYLGSVLKWQRQYNNGGYTDITVPNTAGLTVYSETPAYTGTWDYRAVVQNSPCAAVNSTSTTVTVLTPVGTSKTWTGAAGTDWKNPENWDPKGTPVASDNVIIPATLNLPEVINTVVGCNNLFISKDAKLTVGTTKNLNVAGTLTIEGP